MRSSFAATTFKLNLLALASHAAISVPLGKEWTMRVSVLDQHRADWVTVNSAQTTKLYNSQNTEG